MNRKIRLETIAVIAAVVLFILADVLLMFGFINVFDSLDSSAHGGQSTMSEEVMRPSIGGTTLRGRSGSMTRVDDEAVQNLKKQLEETTNQLLFDKQAQE